jgi:hypothetical protein
MSANHVTRHFATDPKPGEQLVIGRSLSIPSAAGRSCRTTTCRPITRRRWRAPTTTGPMITARMTRRRSNLPAKWRCTTFRAPLPRRGAASPNWARSRSSAPRTRSTAAGLCPPQGATRDRRCPHPVRPTQHHRTRRHRRDVRGGCQLLDPLWLDQARGPEPRRSLM